MPDQKLLEQQIKHSVQAIPDARNGAASVLNAWSTARGPLLPPWGTRAREIRLREYYRMDYNWLIRGSFAGIMKRVASTPWEINGPTEGEYNAAYYQQVFRSAQFGRGWGSFVKMGVDYLRQDVGWVAEIIAPGPADRPPTGPVMGLSHLDSVRCVPTGDPEFPILYWNRDNVLHKMHRTRLLWLQDMPDGDEYRPGYGDCALSRAIGIMWRQLQMERYIEQRLDDEPAPGIVIAHNLGTRQREQAIEAYLAEQNKDTPQVWGRQLWLYGVDPEAQKTSIETHTFSQTPDNWNYKEYTELNVDALALALGVDRQDLWQLTGGNIGSAAQSEILHLKSKGNTIGDLLTELERAFNDILPDEFEFTFKSRDHQDDIMQAQNAQAWGNFALTVQNLMTPEQQRAMLAAKVEAMQDAITDDAGQMQRLNDVDPKREQEAIAGDDAEIVEDAPPAEPVISAEEAERKAAKALQSTRIEFELALRDIIEAAMLGSLERRRFGILVRGLLNRWGAAAYRDGLREGGVADAELDEMDQTRFTSLLAEQSQYVSGLGEQVYKQGISSAEAIGKPEMWFNKSIMPFYNAGLLSAERNANYEWILGRTEEHCRDCLRLNGQVHRLWAWHRREILPQSDKLACNGFNCDCRLQRSDKRANGRF